MPHYPIKGFVAGTPILTATGFKPIEGIRFASASSWLLCSTTNAVVVRVMLLVAPDSSINFRVL